MPHSLEIRNKCPPAVESAMWSERARGPYVVVQLFACQEMNVRVELTQVMRRAAEAQTSRKIS